MPDALVAGGWSTPRPRRLELPIAATAAAARLFLVTADSDDSIGVDRLATVIVVS